MAEYINKEKFMNYIRDTYGGVNQENTCILYYDVIREINEAPIVDACTLLDDIKEELKAMQRLGEFGKRFINYTGDPIGPVGRVGYGNLEREAHYMDVIKDVDGNAWRPVLEETLQHILEKLDNCISRLEKAEEERDAAVKLCGKLIALCSPPKELKPKLFRRHINRPGDYMGCGYDFLDAFNKIICDFIETSDEAIYDRIDRVARQEILGITNKIVPRIKDG